MEADEKEREARGPSKHDHFENTDEYKIVLFV